MMNFGNGDKLHCYGGGKPQINEKKIKINTIPNPNTNPNPDYLQ